MSTLVLVLSSYALRMSMCADEILGWILFVNGQDFICFRPESRVKSPG